MTTGTASVTMIAEQVKHFREKGWVVVPGVFPAAVMDELAELALQLAEKALQDNPKQIMLDHKREDGSLAPRKLDEPFVRHEAFRTALFSTSLPDLVSTLIREPAVLCGDQLFFKPPRHGGPKPYHQDNAYFKCRDDDKIVTAWIGMDDVDEKNACLRYIDGSHLGGVLHHDYRHGNDHDKSPDPTQVDESRESLAPVRKGGVVFHHGATLHCSHRNHSDRWRRGWATHWASPTVGCDSDFISAGHFHRKDLYPQRRGT